MSLSVQKTTEHPMVQPLTKGAVHLYKASQVGMLPVFALTSAFMASLFTRGRVGAGVVKWFDHPTIMPRVEKLTKFSVGGMLTSGAVLHGVEFGLKTPEQRAQSLWNKKPPSLS